MTVARGCPRAVCLRRGDQRAALALHSREREVVTATGPLQPLTYYASRNSVRLVAQGGKLSSEGLLILTSLADAPKHGYAIQLDIASMSGRRLGPGSLYGAIARLETAKYIEGLKADGPRRPYRLTASGAVALAAELDALRKVITTAARRLAIR